MVTELRESTFFATIELEPPGRRSSRSPRARPTRSRSRCACRCRSSRSEDVLEEASILIPGDEEEEVEKFREFLDNVTPGGLRSASSAASLRQPHVQKNTVTQSLPSISRRPTATRSERAIEDVLAVRRAGHEGLLQIRDVAGGPAHVLAPCAAVHAVADRARPCGTGLLRAIARLWASARPRHPVRPVELLDAVARAAVVGGVEQLPGVVRRARGHGRSGRQDRDREERPRGRSPLLRSSTVLVRCISVSPWSGRSPLELSGSIGPQSEGT